MELEKDINESNYKYVGCLISEIFETTSPKLVKQKSLKNHQIVYNKSEIESFIRTQFNSNSYLFKKKLHDSSNDFKYTNIHPNNPDNQLNFNDVAFSAEEMNFLEHGEPKEIEEFANEFGLNYANILNEVVKENKLDQHDDQSLCIEAKLSNLFKQRAEILCNCSNLKQILENDENPKSIIISNLPFIENYILDSLNKILLKFKHLKKLHLVNIHLTDKHIDMISQGLQICKIESINFESNTISGKKIIDIITFIKDNTLLKELKLANQRTTVCNSSSVIAKHISLCSSKFRLTIDIKDKVNSTEMSYFTHPKIASHNSEDVSEDMREQSAKLNEMFSPTIQTILITDKKPKKQITDSSASSSYLNEINKRISRQSK